MVCSAFVDILFLFEYFLEYSINEKRPAAVRFWIRIRIIYVGFSIKLVPNREGERQSLIVNTSFNGQYIRNIRAVQVGHQEL